MTRPLVERPLQIKLLLEGPLWVKLRAKKAPIGQRSQPLGHIGVIVGLLQPWPHGQVDGGTVDRGNGDPVGWAGSIGVFPWVAF